MAKSGFTLIELSIVLVIVGLVIGGILVGRDLIHAAQIRATIAQIEKYNTAVNTFKAKYNCLPGDCANATDFFGVDAVDSQCPDGGASGPVETQVRPVGTCNGDGDGAIGGACTAYDYSIACQEVWRFSQMLNIAGLIQEGPFAPHAPFSGGYPNYIPGVTVPSSKLRPSTGIGIVYFNAVFSCCGSGVSGNTNYTDFNNTHAWTLGAQSSSLFLFGSGISSNEAYAIDAKLDDGLANRGNIKGPLDDHYNCASSITGNYVNSDAFTNDFGPGSQGCYLAIRAAF